MGILARYIMVGLILMGGYAAMSYLQQRFDHADIRKAVTAVQQSRPGGPSTPTLEETLARTTGLATSQIRWEPELESKWSGTVIVTAHWSKQAERPQWRVDLIRQSVTPANEAAQRLKPAE